jgi:hypothetical protein
MASPRARTDSPFENPLLWLAIAPCIAAFGWALSKLWPVIFNPVAVVLAAAVHGVVPGVQNVWVVPVSVVSVSIASVVFSTAVVIRVAKATAEKPFVPALVVVGVLQALVLDITKELYPNPDPVTKILVKASVAAIFIVAALVWKYGGRWPRVGSGLLFALCPMFVIANKVSPALDIGLWNALGHVPASTWYALLAFCSAVLAAIILASALHD